MRARENDCEEHFLKGLFLRGRNFLGGWKYAKENMVTANFKFH